MEFSRQRSSHQSFRKSTSGAAGLTDWRGRNFHAKALGYFAARAGHAVRFIHEGEFFKSMAQAGVDHCVDRDCRSFMTPGSARPR